MIKQWKEITLGPTGARQVQQDDSFIVLESSASLEAAVGFYVAAMAEQSWIQLEYLKASQTRFGGQAAFLLFWQTDRSVCLLVSSAPSTSTSIVLSLDCAGTRQTADNLVATQWDKPSDIEWQMKETDEFLFSYPLNWMEDFSLFDQPICQQASDIECLASVIYESPGKADARVSIIARPYLGSRSVEDMIYDSWRNGSKSLPNPFLVAVEPIILDDGSQALQLLSGYRNRDGLGFVFSVDTVIDNIHYSITGTITGNPQAIPLLSQIIMAMARSFSVISK